MKHLLILLAFACSAAFADTTSAPLPTGTWTLMRSTSNVQAGYPTAAACWAAAGPHAESLKSSANYRCRQDLVFAVTYKKPPVVVPPPNPFPNGESQTVQCVAPTVGSWTQTRRYIYVPPPSNSWTPGAWTPLSAPDGACVTPPPPVEMVTSWGTVAAENYAPATFTAAGFIRYGHDSRWVTKTLNGTFTCTGSTFGNADPAPGLYKLCQELVSAPNVVQTGLAPVVNVALIPKPMKGYSKAIVTSGGGFDAGPFDIGAFRTNCGFSHFNFDDPIVYPKKTGASHLHGFEGNTGTNAFSTTESMMTTGNSTCSGGTANRTGYWYPALINLKTGAPIVPSAFIAYYKSAYYGVPAEAVQPFPPGLKFIAGRSTDTPTSGGNQYIRIHCGASSSFGNFIPNCAVGDTLDFGIQFPQCWDGVNLDSPDHKGHMAYASNGCPPSHPVPLPEVSFNLSYTVTEERSDLWLKLSSDNYAGQGGYSMHADYMIGWNDAIQKAWVKNCINKRASSSNALCNGQYLAD